MINPSELAINDEAPNEAHIASICVRLYQHKKTKGKLVLLIKINYIKHVEKEQL